MLIVGELKSNLDIRAVIHDKSSLAPKGDAFAFKLSKEKGFQWIGKYDINSDELLAGYHKESEKSRATQFILEQLSSGPVASVEIFKQAKINNICERTLNQAKAELNVRSKKNRYFMVLDIKRLRLHECKTFKYCNITIFLSVRYLCYFVESNANALLS